MTTNAVSTAATSCPFTGPGIYMMKEGQKSERTGLYVVSEVLEHPSGPFTLCKSVDPTIHLDIILQGPFDLWAIERIEGGTS